MNNRFSTWGAIVIFLLGAFLGLIISYKGLSMENPFIQILGTFAITVICGMVAVMFYTFNCK